MTLIAVDMVLARNGLRLLYAFHMIYYELQMSSKNFNRDIICSLCLFLFKVHVSKFPK